MGEIGLLKEIYQENKNNVIVFVGAGASKFLGIKTWDTVLKSMRDEFESIELASNNDVQECINDIGHPKTASKLYNEKNDHAEYISFMKSQFNPKEAFHYSIHIKILSLFNVIFTTNYDFTFEKALIDLSYYLKRCECPPIDWNIQKLDNFEPFDTESKPNLVYLHCNHEEEMYIFREEEYQEHYPNSYARSPNSNLESFLAKKFENFSFVFIGFSFDDTVFLKFLQSTLKKLKIKKNLAGASSEMPESFVFYKEDKTDEKKMGIVKILKDDLDLNIICIRNYIDIENILHDLRDEPSKKDVGDAAYA